MLVKELIVLEVMERLQYFMNIMLSDEVLATKQSMHAVGAYTICLKVVIAETRKVRTFYQQMVQVTWGCTNAQWTYAVTQWLVVVHVCWNVKAMHACI